MEGETTAPLSAPLYLPLHRLLSTLQTISFAYGKCLIAFWH